MFSVTYGTGEIKGELISDDVSIGGLIVKGQVFGAVIEEDGDAFIGVFLIKLKSGTIFRNTRIRLPANSSRTHNSYL